MHLLVDYEIKNEKHFLFQTVSGPDPKDKTKIVNDLLVPCSPGEDGAFETTWVEIDGDKLYEPPVTKVSA